MTVSFEVLHEAVLRESDRVAACATTGEALETLLDLPWEVVREALGAAVEITRVRMALDGDPLVDAPAVLYGVLAGVELARAREACRT